MSDTKTAIQPAMTPDEWARALRGDWDDDLGETPDDRHYRAAVNLHGQLFGFSHEDVTMLREISCCPSHTASCNTLADRIAALLPPG